MRIPVASKYMVRLAAAAVAILLIWAVLPRTAASSELPAQWLMDFNKARDMAAKEDKPMLIMFSASWCPPCKEIKAKVLPDAAVQKELNSWVPVYVDVDEQKPLAEQFKIEAMPTFVVLNSKGEEQDRFSGPPPIAPQFLQRLQASREGVAKLTKLNEDLVKTPKDPNLLKAKGDVLLSLDRMDEAMEAYRRAKDLDPENKTGAAADVAYFDALTSIKGIDEQSMTGGDKAMLAVIAKYPNSPRVADATYIRALIALQLRQEAQARQLLMDCQKKYPDTQSGRAAKNMLSQMDKAAATPNGQAKQ